MPGSPFILVRSDPIPSLGLALERFAHPSGASHLHLACDDRHRAFAVAFRTPPADDRGLPHILEHTTLCGSSRFPVHDPFFAMLRRSLQTFMNAVTFPDLTCYPFATQIPRDFDNLLDVYLDAVFAPRLDPLDFAQEGHRLSRDPEGVLRTGVVFNEMTGAMDNTSSQIEAAIGRHLLPDTCYRWNSGGEPGAIPELTHADLLAFHRRMYVAGNACIATYGDVDLAALHGRLQGYLTNVPGPAQPVPRLQPALPEPQRIMVPVPWSGDQDADEVACANLTWVWGDSSDPDRTLDGEFLDELLLGHAGAPLRMGLESSGLGRSLGASGYQATYRDGLMTIEIDGIDPEDYERFEPLVRRILEEKARDGFDADAIRAAVNQIELARREIGGDAYPFGLELCLRAVQEWNHGADPLTALDQDAALERLRRRASSAHACGLIHRLLAQPHHGLFLAQPDRTYQDRVQADSRRQARDEVERLGPDGPARVESLNAALAVRQGLPEDPSILPRLGLEDIPRDRPWARASRIEGGVTSFAARSNGLIHSLAALPLTVTDRDTLQLDVTAAMLFGNVGAGERSYAEQARLVAGICGGLWASVEIAADPRHGILAHLLIEIKGLADRHAAFIPVLSEAFCRGRWDEHERIGELLDQEMQRLQDRVQGAGSRLAARAAARGFAGAAGLGHDVSGLGRLAWLKARAAGDIAGLARELERRHQTILKGPVRCADIGDKADADAIRAATIAAWGPMLEGHRIQGSPGIPATPALPTAFLTTTTLNYCALALPCPSIGHPDAPALAVAAHFLTNNRLHRVIREQGGAYGAGATYNPASGLFAVTSYRDPGLERTFSAMDEALAWILSTPIEKDLLDEAVLGVIAGLDAPGSPTGEARGRFVSDLSGLGPEYIDPYRAAVIGVAADDIRRAAAAWLGQGTRSRAVITNAATAERECPTWARERI